MAEATTSSWKPEQLDRIGQAVELQLASDRPDGSLRPCVTMWVVRVGDNLYVRSAYGRDNPWFRRAMASGAGRIGSGGVERSATFAEAAADVQGAIDAAYQAKYDRYAQTIVGSVVGTDAHQATVRLVSDPEKN
jgi:hypothetical protein